MPWVNKSQWDMFAYGGHKYNTGNGKVQIGRNGDGVSPTDYTGNFGKGFPDPMFVGPNGAVGPNPNAAGVGQFYSAINGNTFGAARNQAWSDLVESARSGPASLGVSLAESRQGLDMVVNRAASLYRAYRNLRKGDFRKALRELSVSPRRKHRSKVKNAVNDASSLWLEYSFGWKPMLGDIYQGVQTLGKPVPGGDYSGKGRQDWKLNTLTSSSGARINATVRCKQGAFIWVSNPNQYLSQQLGLVNPLLIAWELVPFSFLVDWVADVGTCLSSATDLYGCGVSRGYHTYSARNVPCVVAGSMGGISRQVNGRASAVRRRVGLSYPIPNFNVRTNIGGSLNRAANAVSLLGQILAK